MADKKEIIQKIETKGSIDKSDLKRLQTLKDCTDWNSVKPLGLIDFHSDFHHYEGGIVEFQGNPCYITKNQISALMKFVKWKFKHSIKVIDDEKKK